MDKIMDTIMKRNYSTNIMNNSMNQSFLNNSFWKKGNLSFNFVISMILLIIIILVSLIAFVRPFRQRAMNIFGITDTLESKADSIKRNSVVEIDKNNLIDLFSKKFDPWLNFIVLPTLLQYKLDINSLDEISKNQIEARLKVLCNYLKEYVKDYQNCFLINTQYKVWDCEKNKWVERSNCKFVSKTDDQTLYYLFFTKNGIYVGEFKQFKK